MDLGILVIHVHTVHGEKRNLGGDLGTVVPTSKQGGLDLGQVGELCVSRQLVKPQVIDKVIVVSFVDFIDGLIVVTTVIIAKSGQDNTVGEVFLKLGESRSEVGLDCPVVRAIRIVTHSVCSNFVSCRISRNQDHIDITEGLSEF